MDLLWNRLAVFGATAASGTAVVGGTVAYSHYGDGEEQTEEKHFESFLMGDPKDDFVETEEGRRFQHEFNSMEWSECQINGGE